MWFKLAHSFLVNHVRYMLSPIRLSVICNVRAAYSAGWNFSAPFGTLAIRWRPCKILQTWSQGNPSVGVKHKRAGTLWWI